MRRLVMVVAVVMGCRACGEVAHLPTDDAEALQEWQRAHLQPKVTGLLADADCACTELLHGP